MSKVDKPVAIPQPGAADPQLAMPGHNSPLDQSGIFSSYVADNAHAYLAAVTGVTTFNRAEIIRRIREGLSIDSIRLLEQALHTSRKEIAEILSISVSTLGRRKQGGRLGLDESDRVVRLARLLDAAVDMMHGDKDAATTWLRSPLEILGGESPIAHAETELGARDVEDLIGRIKHGVFS